ncbi:hypothetical protein H6501_01570 [Candidatus Woesearchaeota archaeon]|nr:hypothetical protein [Nanoarchaeota archaeon]MCB9370264.1 hypothetical protein [Candidatus Woesearchaeota archaeon]USN44788.1 MAG: hypothetical protein H6500_03015 [Candidatus Woesearchaeota archaeon]
MDEIRVRTTVGTYLLQSSSPVYLGEGNLVSQVTGKDLREGQQILIQKKGIQVNPQKLENILYEHVPKYKTAKEAISLQTSNGDLVPLFSALLLEKRFDTPTLEAILQGRVSDPLQKEIRAFAHDIKNLGVTVSLNQISQRWLTEGTYAPKSWENLKLLSEKLFSPQLGEIFESRGNENGFWTSYQYRTQLWRAVLKYFDISEDGRRNDSEQKKRNGDASIGSLSLRKLLGRDENGVLFEEELNLVLGALHLVSLDVPDVYRTKILHVGQVNKKKARFDLAPTEANLAVLEDYPKPILEKQEVIPAFNYLRFLLSGEMYKKTKVRKEYFTPSDLQELEKNPLLSDLTTALLPSYKSLEKLLPEQFTLILEHCRNHANLGKEKKKEPFYLSLLTTLESLGYLEATWTEQTNFLLLNYSDSNSHAIKKNFLHWTLPYYCLSPGREESLFEKLGLRDEYEKNNFLPVLELWKEIFDARPRRYKGIPFSEAPLEHPSFAKAMGM